MAKGKLPAKDTSTATIGGNAELGPEHADTFRRDLHPDLCADHVLAVRFHFGVPLGLKSNN